MDIMPSSTVEIEVNRTIDDTNGDSVTGAKPIYLPRCAIQPDPNLAFVTWHGLPLRTAIYVFFILPNTVGPGITTQTECNFTLDGQAAGNFFHAPSSSIELIYNALVFSSSNLMNTQHTLHISTSGVDHSVFINFDYAIYTSVSCYGILRC
ncbi:hypothetical protein L208DRAFT_1427093 [Tricholoma matsutake]|nr:hypothetical protein L208DRAFT_1427093 [Tricholoma matsutake 945]